MTKHTPAPWIVEDGSTTVYALNNEPRRNKRFAAYVQPGHDDDGKRVDRAEIQANARLIAQAPAMLDALRLIADAGVDAKQCAEIARAGIAGATGEWPTAAPQSTIDPEGTEQK